MKFADLSDIGRVRQTNEDYTWSGVNGYNIFAGVVCDGLGGYKGGSAASEITVNVFKEMFLKTDLNAYTKDQITEWINNIIEKARKQISQYIKEKPNLANMATTFVCCLIIENKAYIYNIGDSRAWLISKYNESKQITVDQNLMNYLIKINAPQDMFRTHRDNLYAITQFVGAESKKKIVPDLFVETLDKGDYIVLTSDGCHNFIELEDIIQTILFDAQNLEDACNSIISQSLVNDSNDNLSIVILGA